jgi:hypothetical protein
MTARGEKHTVFWLENLKGRDLSVGDKITLEWILRNTVGSFGLGAYDSG